MISCHLHVAYLRPSPFAQLTCLERIFSPVLDTLQKVHLFEIAATTSVGIERVLDVARLGSNVRTPVHRRLVQRRDLLGLRRLGYRGERRARPFGTGSFPRCRCHLYGGWRSLLSARSRPRRRPPRPLFRLLRVLWYLDHVPILHDGGAQQRGTGGGTYRTCFPANKYVFSIVTRLTGQGASGGGVDTDA